MSHIKLTRTTFSSPDFQALVKLLDTELKVYDGDDHSFYSQYNKIESIKHVIKAIPNYEQYTNIEKSICFRKELKNNG